MVGGGSGGCAVAAKFRRKMDAKSIAVIEPADVKNSKSKITAFKINIQNAFVFLTMADKL